MRGNKKMMKLKTWLPLYNVYFHDIWFTYKILSIHYTLFKSLKSSCREIRYGFNKYGRYEIIDAHELLL